MNLVIKDSNKKFTINTIFCIGRNYLEHAKELNHQIPKEPVVFTKPNNSLLGSGKKIILPKQSNDVHYEGELVVLIGKAGKHIAEQTALKHIAGIGVGIDVTARDIQQKAISAGKPWAIAKGFDTFTQLSEFVPCSAIPDLNNINFTLSINDQLKQNGASKNMIFALPFLIHYLSQHFTLCEGDIIFTGTPSGVGRLNNGDLVSVSLQNNLVVLNVKACNEVWWV